MRRSVLSIQPQYECGDLAPTGIEVLLPESRFEPRSDACATLLKRATDEGLFKALAGRVAITFGCSVPFIESGQALAAVSRQIEQHPQLRHSLTLSLRAGDDCARREKLVDHMLALQVCGVQLALDCFGSPTSGVSQVMMLPLDQVRLDLGLTRAMRPECDRQLPADLVQGLVGTLRQYRMAVLACGVESAAELHRARQMGCSHVQGDALCASQPWPLLVNTVLAGVARVDQRPDPAQARAGTGRPDWRQCPPSPR